MDCFGVLKVVLVILGAGLSKQEKTKPSATELQRCIEGVDQLDRREQFWKYNHGTFPRLNDAFAKRDEVHFIFLVRDWRKKTKFTPNNTDWICFFNECEAVNGSFMVDNRCNTELVTCRIPETCRDIWRTDDQRHELARNVSLSARSQNGELFSYDQIQFCIYPDPDHWTPSIRAKKSGGGEIAEGKDRNAAIDAHYPLNLAMCVFFKVHYGSRNRDLMVEWIAYNVLQGAQHFYVYVNEDSRDTRTLLRPHVDDGLVSIVEWRWNASQPNNPTNWAFQLTQINSCRKRYSGLARWSRNLTLILHFGFTHMKGKKQARCCWHLTLPLPNRWVGFMDIDEFFQPLDPATPTVSAFLAALRPDVAVVHINSVFYGNCKGGARYQGLATQACRSRQLRDVYVRGKNLVRPDRVLAMDVHFPMSLHNGFRVLEANPRTAVRMNHYKLKQRYGKLSCVADASMLALGPALTAAIAKAYPDGLPQLPGR